MTTLDFIVPGNPYIIPGVMRAPARPAASPARAWQQALTRAPLKQAASKHQPWRPAVPAARIRY